MSNGTLPGDPNATALVVARAAELEKQIELEKAKAATVLADKRFVDSQHQLAFQVAEIIRRVSESAAAVMRRQDEQVAAISLGFGTPAVVIILAYFILLLGQGTGSWQNAAFAGTILALTGDWLAPTFVGPLARNTPMRLIRKPRNYLNR